MKLSIITLSALLSGSTQASAQINSQTTATISDTNLVSKQTEYTKKEVIKKEAIQSLLEQAKTEMDSLKKMNARCDKCGKG